MFKTVKSGGNKKNSIVDSWCT